MEKLRPPIKIHGGKFYLSPWIISQFPENYETLNYVEPFFGGGNVLINKKKSSLEVACDKDLGVVQIFRALRDQPDEFIKKLKTIKYNEKTFEKHKAMIEFDNYLDHAVSDFVTRRMSRGGLKKNFSLSDRVRGKNNESGDINAWKTCIQMLPVIAERVKEVHIFNKPAIEVIKIFNDPNTLFYVDPPYLHESRISLDSYEYEMTTEEHVELAKVLNATKAKVILSGYASKLYDELYKDWKKKKKQIANHSSQKKVKAKKTEVLWINF